MPRILHLFTPLLLLLFIYPVSLFSQSSNSGHQINNFAADSVNTSFGIKNSSIAVPHSASQVQTDQLRVSPGTDFSRMMKGAVPGMDVTASGGVSGSGTDMIIRGHTSINGSNDPLIIVDGVRLEGGVFTSSDMFRGGGTLTTPNRFIDLDPGIITDVTVLRSLAATVLYGNEGRNGVILITTEAGDFSERSEPGFDVSFSQSVYGTQISSRPDYQNRYGIGFGAGYGMTFSSWGPAFDADDQLEFGNFFRGFDDDGTVLVAHPLLTHGPTAAAFPMLQDEDYRYEPKTDPIDAFFRTGLGAASRLSISGQSGNISLNTTYSRSSEEGFTPNNQLQRDHFGFGVSYPINSRVSSSTVVNISRTTTETPPLAATAGSGPPVAGGTTSVLADIFYTPRSIDLNMPHQNPVTGGSAYYRQTNDIPHPRWTAENALITDESTRYFGKTELEVRVAQGLNFRYRLGYDNFTVLQQYRQNPQGVRPGAFQPGFYQTINTGFRSWDHAAYLQLNKDELAGSFSVDAIAGLQSYREKVLRNGLESRQMIVSGLFNHTNFVQQEADNSFTGEDLQDEQERRTTGIFSDLTFGYNHFLYLNFAFRNDWVSSLRSDERSIFYPRVGFSYLPLRQLDYRNSLLSDLRIYASYAKSGRAPKAFENTGDVQNPELKPEQQQEFSAGLELELFEGRTAISAERYSRTVSDFIFLVPAFPDMLRNIGEMEMSGFEFSARATPLNRSLRWDSWLTFYKSDSEVTDFEIGQEFLQVGDGLANLGNVVSEGEPFMMLAGQRIFRVTQEMREQFPEFADVAEGTPVLDSFGNYLTDPQLGVIGDPNPDWQLYFNSSLQYRNLTLRFQFDYQHGGDMYSRWISTLIGRGVTTTTADNRDQIFIREGVDVNGNPSTAEITAASYHFQNVTGPAEVRVYDMTHLRLSHLSLSWKFPVQFLEYTPFSSATFTLSGHNLWLHMFNLPDGVGFDPNVNSAGAGTNNRGLEYLTGPGARQFGGNLTIRF